MRRVTKENLIAQIERLRKIKDEQGQLSTNSEYTLQAYKMLLATMEVEPVAWIVHAHTGDQLTTYGGYVANAEGILGLHSTPLYRHAQPAQVVPEKATVGEMPFLGTSEGAYVRGWNDCRAAMLNGGKP